MSNKTSYDQFKADIFGLLIYLIVFSILVFLFKIIVLSVCFGFFILFKLINSFTGSKKSADRQAVVAANIFFFGIIAYGLYWFFSQVNGIGNNTTYKSSIYDENGNYSNEYKKGLDEAKQKYNQNMFGK